MSDDTNSARTAGRLLEATPLDQRPRFLVRDNAPLLRGEFEHWAA